jgi:hypothetical protein
MSAARGRSDPGLVRLAAVSVAFVAIVGIVYTATSRSGWIGGDDFLAYDAAVQRLLAGRPLYDPTVPVFGAPFAFFYPPPFVFLVLPFAALPADVARDVWTVGLVVASLAALLLMPVSRGVRTAVIALAAVSWPLFFAIKLGQIGPVLLLLFVIGWRSLDRPAALGVAIALGGVAKIQPIVLAAWAWLTGRRRAASICIGTVAALALLATAWAGPGAWRDEVALLERVAAAGAKDDVGVGHLLLLLGLPVPIAFAANVAQFVVVVVLLLWATRRVTAEASYLAFVVGSQLLSAILWDHYALVLLAPIAWLLARGAVWSAAIPLATSIPLRWITPAATYPIAFWITLAAVLWLGRAERVRADALRAGPRLAAVA